MSFAVSFAVNIECKLILVDRELHNQVGFGSRHCCRSAFRNPRSRVTGAFGQSDFRAVGNAFGVQRFSCAFFGDCQFVQVGVDGSYDNVTVWHNCRNFALPFHKVVAVVVHRCRRRRFYTRQFVTRPEQVFFRRGNVTFRSNAGSESDFAQSYRFVQLVVKVVVSDKAQTVVVANRRQSVDRHNSRFLIDADLFGRNTRTIQVQFQSAVVNAGNCEQIAQSLNFAVFDCGQSTCVVAIFVRQFESYGTAAFGVGNVHFADVGSKHIGRRFAVHSHHVVNVDRSFACFVEFCFDFRTSSLFRFRSIGMAVFVTQHRVAKSRPHYLHVVDRVRTGY